jgi:hypothetical protein
MQRIANPFTSVRLRDPPPFNARVVELVDTRDLKSLVSNDVPVQVRLRVPFQQRNLVSRENIHIGVCIR